ncbi:glycosyltransferase family 2 protein [Rothia nasimurium]|uniref:glycosyltransferase family 2 protein n=1 Tax=Rothia nasimurium TaxID=85336 RepID=UPI001F18CC8B|nr:glycosyltransferase family 2 protein [Rothia nasimurium]
MPNIDISVVIGFRNWGAQRIKMSARSIAASFGSYTGEIIISDYGSDDPQPVKAVADELGLKYVYTAGDTVWSRSRALNAGFAIAEGKVLVSTDADMLFSPDSFAVIYETIADQPNSALFLQCRDLPSTMSAEALEEIGHIGWDELEAAGRLRPRWGMGGMMAISRQGMNAVRGFDERLHTYGGEDLDFALRARRAGYKTVWIDDPRVRMYHMWHPSSRAAADQSEAGRRAVQFNKDVVYHDTTTLRNTLRWKHRLADATPLVTVAISTYNRADLLGESIQAVLMQTMPDFELVIVDDGSTDNTEEVVRSFNDPRIRYFYQENAGISAARNHILRESRGIFTAVLDDDDLMHPRRLEWQLEALEEGLDGTVGAFINFDNYTGAYKLFFGYNPSQNQLTFSRATPGHGTWLVRTSLLKAVGYDETITSGVDHNIFLRMIRVGGKFKHIGKPLLLRRIHDGQITASESDRQEHSALQSWRFFRYTMNQATKKHMEDTKPSSYYTPKDPVYQEASLLPYLPDSIVTRDAWVTIHPDKVELAQNLDTDGTASFLSLEAGISEVPSRLITVTNASYRDLVKLSQLGNDISATITGFTNEATDALATLGVAEGAKLPTPGAGASSTDTLTLLTDEFKSLYPETTAIDIYTFHGAEHYQAFKAACVDASVQSLGLSAQGKYLFAVAAGATPETGASDGAMLWMTLGKSAEDIW